MEEVLIVVTYGADIEHKACICIGSYKSVTQLKIGQRFTRVKHMGHILHIDGIEIAQIQAGQVIAEREHPPHIRHIGSVECAQVQVGQ